MGMRKDVSAPPEAAKSGAEKTIGEFERELGR